MIGTCITWYNLSSHNAAGGAHYFPAHVLWLVHASYTGLDNYKSQSALGVSSFPEEINYNQLCSRREIQKHFLSTCTEKCIMRKTQVQSSGYSVLSGGGGRRGRAETLIHIWEAALLAKVGSLLPP